MTAGEAVETSVIPPKPTVLSQDYNDVDDQLSHTCNATSIFKPFNLFFKTLRSGPIKGQAWVSQSPVTSAGQIYPRPFIAATIRLSYSRITFFDPLTNKSTDNDLTQYGETVMDHPADPMWFST